MSSRTRTTHPVLRRTVLALAGLAAIGCGGQGQDLVAPTTTEPALLVAEQSADVFQAPAGTVSLQPWGSATIRRGPTGIQVKIKVTDATLHAALAGNAITMWVASFNDPDACDVPGVCGFGDLFVPAVGGAIQRAGGQVLGSGPITLTFNVREGEAKASDKLFGAAPGLVDAETDEIHVVIKSHGPPIPGMVDEQIHTVGGGCGINTCVDAAVLVFR